MAQVLGKMSVILVPVQTRAFTGGPGTPWAGWSQGPRPWALAESGLCSLSPCLHIASLPSALHLAQNVTCARAVLPAEITLSVLFTWSWVILHIAAGECFFASSDGLTHALHLSLLVQASVFAIGGCSFGDSSVYLYYWMQCWAPHGEGLKHGACH